MHLSVLWDSLMILIKARHWMNSQGSSGTVGKHEFFIIQVVF
jgi:hypothetical protein